MRDFEVPAGQEFVEIVNDSQGIYEGPHKLMFELALQTGGRYMPLRPPPPQTLNACNSPTGESLYSGEQNGLPRLRMPPQPGADPQKQYYDPYCRSFTQQVEDYAKELASDTVYVLAR